MSKETLFLGQKVVIMGLGLHGGGVGVAKWFYKHKADVLITDLKIKKQLAESLDKLTKYTGIKYRLGEHKGDDFRQADIVIANPAVRSDNRFLQIAKKSGAAIHSDQSIFIQHCPCKIIAVTGTKGKSTTSSLIYHHLKTTGYDVYLGGNIRISPFTFIDKLKDKSLVVLEVSSWQAESWAQFNKSPQIGVLTNLGIDHLNTYKSLDAYHRAKINLFKNQTKDDYIILPLFDDNIKKYIKDITAKKIYFNKSKTADYSIKNQVLYNKDKKIINLDNISLYGKHNLTNILCSLAVISIFDIKNSDIKKSLNTYKTLGGRMELVKKHKGVDFINDTTATAPTAAVAAINSMDKKITLIAGGTDKELKYEEFIKTIKRQVKNLILLPGSATDIIKDKLDNINYDNYILVNNMDQAVKKSYQITKPGEVVVLSPGAASFGLFINEFDRGDKFIKAVKKYAKK